MAVVTLGIRTDDLLIRREPKPGEASAVADELKTDVERIVEEHRVEHREVVGDPGERALLSVTTFGSFVREFSPF